MKYSIFDLQKSAKNIVTTAAAVRNPITSLIVLQKKLDSDENLLQHKTCVVTLWLKKKLMFDYN